MGGNKEKIVSNILNYLKDALNSIEVLTRITYEETKMVVQDNAVVDYLQGNHVLLVLPVNLVNRENRHFEDSY